MLLATGAARLGALVSWLLLAVTLLFAFGPRRTAAAQCPRTDRPAVTGGVEFVFAVYGGYFGAGLGVLPIAALTNVGMRDVEMAKAQKNWLAIVITTISVAVFALGGTDAWRRRWRSS